MRSLRFPALCLSFVLFVSGCLPELPAPGAYAFPFGLASSDPGRTSIVLWTAVAGAGEGARPDSVEVVVQVSPTEDFGRLAWEGTIRLPLGDSTGGSIRVEGLFPATVYYYRFVAGIDTPERPGRTRTAPEEWDDSAVVLAWMSGGTTVSPVEGGDPGADPATGSGAMPDARPETGETGEDGAPGSAGASTAEAQWVRLHEWDADQPWGSRVQGVLDPREPVPSRDPQVRAARGAYPRLRWRPGSGGAVGEGGAGASPLRWGRFLELPADAREPMPGEIRIVRADGDGIGIDTLAPD